MTELQFGRPGFIWWSDKDDIPGRERVIIIEKLTNFHRDTNKDVSFYGANGFLTLARGVDDTSYATIFIAILEDQRRRHL